MFTSATSIIVAVLSVLLLSSQCQAKSVIPRNSESRTKREVSSYDVLSPVLVQHECYARPCYSNRDCCLGYACTGVRDVDTRAGPQRSCVLSMEELESLI